MTGSGEQPTSLPKHQHSEPPIRGPEDPHGDGRMFMEILIKWGAIAIVAFFLILAFGMILNCETEPSQRQQRATAEAAAETREAVKQRVNPRDSD
ncbi:MAG: hypothetical protein HOE43_07775 [Chloroflexi bacterium]|jgi:hypothetical protein|nr:hypothetical protein [Chloroflexota bacterium]